MEIYIYRYMIKKNHLVQHPYKEIFLVIYGNFMHAISRNFFLFCLN